MPKVIRAFYLPVAANLQLTGETVEVLLKLHRCLSINNRADKGDSDAPAEIKITTEQIDAAQALVVSQQVSEAWIMNYVDQFGYHEIVMLRSQEPNTRTGLLGNLV